MWLRHRAILGALSNLKAIYFNMIARDARRNYIFSSSREYLGRTSRHLHATILKHTGEYCPHSHPIRAGHWITALSLLASMCFNMVSLSLPVRAICRDFSVILFTVT